MKLTKDFFINKATFVAPNLIGKILVRKVNNEIFKYEITETECYYGEEDTACHAHKGKTERTKIMYEEGGKAYIYLCYGIHNLLNVVTGDKGFPEAVLIRGIEGINGPGKLTKQLSIDRSLNGVDLTTSDELFIEDNNLQPEYHVNKRIGIDYAKKEDRDRLWRYTKKS